MSRCDHPQCVLPRNHRAVDGTPCIASSGEVLRLSNKYGAADNLAAMVRRLPRKQRDRVMRFAADVVLDCYEQEAHDEQ